MKITLYANEEQNQVEENFNFQTSNQYLQAQKTKPIRKRKQRQINQNSKWTTQHFKRYYMFYVVFATENPFYHISWSGWKPEKIYPKMAMFINSKVQLASKNQIQCKSLDQRLKNQYFKGKNIDIIDLSLQKLREFNRNQFDQEVQLIIDSYNSKKNQKSPHMILCHQKIQALKDCQNTLKSLWEDILTNGVYQSTQICQNSQSL